MIAFYPGFIELYRGIQVLERHVSPGPGSDPKLPKSLSRSHKPGLYADAPPLDLKVVRSCTNKTGLGLELPFRT